MFRHAFHRNHDMDLNRATLIGNVTRDVELRTTAGGQNVALFSIATNQQWKDASGTVQKRAEYHNLVAWGKLADICQQYLTKGTKIYAEGRLQTREWEAQDATKKTRTEIVLENMIMLSPKAAGAPRTAPAPTGQPPAYQPQGTAPTQDINPEDIPF